MNIARPDAVIKYGIWKYCYWLLLNLRWDNSCSSNREKHPENLGSIE